MRRRPSTTSPCGPIPPERIRLGGIGYLSAAGGRFVELAKGATLDVTPGVPGVNHAKKDVSGFDRVLYSWCVAVVPTNRMRSKVGVGERVFITSVPELPAETRWTATGGGLKTRTNAWTFWVAPSNAASVTVTATLPDGYEARKVFNVVEPSGVEKAKILSTFTNYFRDLPPPPIGLPGAAMAIQVFIGPLDVSLARVEISEVAGGAENVSGYFANPSMFQPTPEEFLYHWPAGVTNVAYSWIPLEADNSIGDYVALRGEAFPPPWTNGAFVWNIPARWRIGEGPTNAMPGWQQRFSIDSAGTVSISKFGKTVTRQTNGLTTPAL